MKIAMLIDAWYPIVGGGQVHVYNLCKKLIENHGCKIDLFVRSTQRNDGKIYNKDEYLFDNNLKIIRCGRPKPFFNIIERFFSIFSTLFCIIKENKSKKYDLIHAHTFLFLISGKLCSFLLNIPIIITIHGANLLDKGKISIPYYIEKILLTKIRYNKIISVGSSFLKYTNINKNISVIPNGVNIEEFDCAKIEKRKDIFKILFVGRLEWTKGIDILINAINQFKKEDKRLLDRKKIEFHLIGYGYQEEEYKNLVEKHSLGKYVKFRGLISGINLIKEYKESSLFILPSRTEGFGITILEAMASDIPVIATKCGGPEDIIQDGVNGFLIEKENYEQLYNTLSKVIKLRVDILDDIVKNGRNMLISNYSWDGIGERVFFEYRKLI